MPTTSPTRADLRTHYRRIEQMIKRERAARVTVLRNAPNLPAKLDECWPALPSWAKPWPHSCRRSPNRAG
jgi:hypothetical protein